uniref:Response regulator n=1 Tax=Geobacter metallireducens TaxID=28232 RepID=A0A831U3W3_GEOME
MGNRVLLADDSITIQKVVGIIFANEDYDLTVVDNGDAAVEKAREASPDVMLVDAIMPGMSGYEVCSAIRRDPALGNVPILLMTGAFEPFDEEKARQCGADDFISKPFESQQLIDKVKNLLELGKSRAVTAPAAPAATVAPAMAAAPEPVVPAAQEPEESFIIEFDEPAFEEPQPVVAPPPVAGPVAARVPTPEPHPFAFEIEEVSPADDLWGAFELEDEVVEEAPVQFGQVSAAAGGAAPAAEPVSAGSDQAADIFGFGVEPAAGEVDFGIPAAGDEFVFSDETEETEVLAPAEPAPFSAPPMEEPFAFGEVGAADVVEPYGTISQAPVSEELVPAMEPFEASRGDEFTAPALEETVFAPEEPPVPAPLAAAPAPAEAAGTITLTEEQLAAAISRISREVIERIAWEVVPDLAETLIKEEIRRIKEGS